MWLCRRCRYAAKPSRSKPTRWSGCTAKRRRSSAAMDSTFVGRQRELAQLGDLIRGSPSGFQSATVIVAPASAGKSSLLTELHRRHAGDARWAMARCSEYDRGTPYMALRQLTLHILRSSGRGLDVLQGSPSETASAPLAALAQLLSPNVERTNAGVPGAGRLALASAFTQLLTENAVRECLVLAIDGVQWIDFESLAVLDAVVPDLEDARVVLITTARPDWHHTWPNEVLTVRLERLSRQECAQFVSFLLRSTAVAPATLDILARESDGNPLLLAEMVRSGVESGALCEAGGGMAPAAPRCSGDWGGRRLAAQHHSGAPRPALVGGAPGAPGCRRARPELDRQPSGAGARRESACSRPASRARRA